MTAPADDNRRDQTPTCATAERERLTRERDDWKRVAEGLNAFMERARSKTNHSREGLLCLREFDALKAKEATPSTSPIVGSVEEVSGGMGEDYAVVVLRSGHAIEVSAEGVVAWPSREAQRRADNSDVIDGISFRRKKEATP